MGTKKEKSIEIFEILKKTYPDAKCSLDFKNPYELLVATILSAQCTDERVNKVTPKLFARYPSTYEMANADIAEVEGLIQSTGFYRNKAKSLISCCKDIVELHHGNVPSILEKLTKLRGVGRKTANVVLGSAFGVPGIIVDTHFGRLAYRMGFTKQRDPVKIEHEMMKIVPQKLWTHFSNLLVFHGRNRCTARRPDCEGCEVKELCPKIGVKNKRISSRSAKSAKTLFSALLIGVFLFGGCASKEVVYEGEKFVTPNESSVPLNRPVHYFENDLAFQPKRLWKIHVDWDPDPTDYRRAYIHKSFQLIVSDKKERKKIEKKIAELGGDEAFLRWFEGEVLPLGTIDVRYSSGITRYNEALIVILSTQSKKSHPIQGKVSITPVSVPEPLLQIATQRCKPLDWGILNEGDSFGIEVVLEGRNKKKNMPKKASKWIYAGKQLPELTWQAWSVGQEHQITYRVAARIEKTIARCPIAPSLKEQFESLRNWQAMEISWSVDQQMPEKREIPQNWPYLVEKKKTLALDETNQTELDSLRWPEDRKKGWECLQVTKQYFPQATTTRLQSYLYGLAQSFSMVIEKPNRHHFFIADTLNPTMWHCGGGFFILHAGLFRYFEKQHMLDFLVAMKLAHLALEHHLNQLDPLLVPQPTYIDFWSLLVNEKPFLDRVTPYTVQEEIEALKLVYLFFEKQGWDLNYIEKQWQESIDRISSFKNASIVHAVHSNLAEALRFTKQIRPKVVKNYYEDPVVNEDFFKLGVAEIKSSKLQRFDWMLAGLGVDESKQTGELNYESFYYNKLAQAYLRGKESLAQQQWQKVVEESSTGLKWKAGEEPFLWQQAIALQSQGKFLESLKLLSTPWMHFDDRRRLLIVQSLFLDGQFSQAEKKANEYRKDFPTDIDGYFWHTLTKIRLRKASVKDLEFGGKFWGDRPLVRALFIFFYHYLKKPSAVQKALAMDTSDPYFKSFSKAEWEVFSFAKAWVSNWVSGDETQALDSEKSKWRLAKWMWRRLPLTAD